MMNYFMAKIVTLAAILFLNGSPWVTEVDKYCYVKEITEETDENGVTWTVYHCGAKED